MSYHRFGPYVPAAKRRANAEQAIKKLAKQKTLQPIQLQTRTISQTFWGKAWCRHLESFSDHANRLPRGRTYVRQGLVCHLVIHPGTIEATVCGSSMYHVNIAIAPLPSPKWALLKQQCMGKIASLLELLTGKLSQDVMEVVCDRENGLFPLSKEIKLSCDCPDWATMCKHVAAVLYGVAVRLDASPEQLFLLRGVDHQALVDPSALIAETTDPSTTKQRRIDTAVAGDIFGISLTNEKDASAVIATSSSKKTKKKPLSICLSSPSQTKKTATTKKKKKVATSTFPTRLTGSSIYKKRHTLNWSQQQFAKAVGVNVSTISRWESMGRRTLTTQKEITAKLSALWKTTT